MFSPLNMKLDHNNIMACALPIMLLFTWVYSSSSNGIGSLTFSFFCGSGGPSAAQRGGRPPAGPERLTQTQETRPELPDRDRQPIIPSRPTDPTTAGCQRPTCTARYRTPKRHCICAAASKWGGKTAKGFPVEKWGRGKRRPGMFGIKSPVREGIPEGGRAARARLKSTTSLKVFTGWQCWHSRTTATHWP